MTVDSIPARFIQQAQKNAQHPAYAERIDGEWRVTTWSQYVDDTRRVAHALLTLGLNRGDKVSLLGFNRSEWHMMAMATLLCGGVPVGIYTTCSAEEVQYVVNHSESKLVLVEDESQWNKIKPALAQLSMLEKVVTMRGALIADDKVINWNELVGVASGSDVTQLSNALLDERLSHIDGDDLATLIYTSGTTGPTKGVMLSHNNLIWTAHTLIEAIECTKHDRFLSFLPMCHIAEQMCSLHAAAVSGHTTYFAESLDDLPRNIVEVQPTVFFAVPRLWEKFQAAVSEKLNAATGFKKRLALWAMKTARTYHSHQRENQPKGLTLQWQYQLAQVLLFKKLKKKLGLSHARLCNSGGAPISAEILDWFTQLDIVIQEVYGQSEMSGATTFTPKSKVKLGSVGKVIEGIECKIADDGEILFKAPSVFQGYYKDPETTAKTIVDGWMHSGDLGELDNDGYLRVTGRKKDIIITSGGKNITPRNIEDALISIDGISQAVVIGDRRKYLSALLTLDAESVESLCKRFDTQKEWLSTDKAFLNYIQQHIDAINQRFSRVENIRRFSVLTNEFSLEKGELTPTLKIKRQVIAEKYAKAIDAMYEEREATPA